MISLDDFEKTVFPKQLKSVGEERIKVILEEGLTNSTLVRADEKSPYNRFYKTDERLYLNLLETDYVFKMPEQSKIYGKRVRVLLKTGKGCKSFEGIVVRADLKRSAFLERYSSLEILPNITLIKLSNGFLVQPQECELVLHQ